MSLSPKQEKFAQCIADGMNQSDAYRAAYGCEGWKPESIYSKSAALAATDKVKQRIAELKGALEQKALWTREDSVNTLKEVLADPEARCNDKTTAVKVLNDMHGYNAPQEINHNIANLDELIAAVLGL